MSQIDFKAYKLGAKPDRQDRRDKYKSDRYGVGTPLTLPSSYTLPFLPPIKDQGQTNSCTGHAATWMMEQIIVSRKLGPWFCLSPMYSWYYARLDEGDQTQDTGVQMRTIMSSLNKYGVTPEEQWPHGSPIDQQPPAIASTLAAIKLPVYERCDTLESIKYSLAVEKQAVCIGVEVSEVWYAPSVAETGIIPFDMSSKILGGHAVCVCGYNDQSQLLMIANSWSTAYAKNGFFYYPYSYLSALWFDAWTAGFNTLPPA